MSDSHRTSPEIRPREMAQRATARSSEGTHGPVKEEDCGSAEHFLTEEGGNSPRFSADDSPPEGECPSSATVSEEELELGVTLDLSSGILRRQAEQLRSEDALPDGNETSDVGPSSDGGQATTPTYRPTQRPPTAVIQVFDDDQARAELVRVRRTPFDIGRQEGDLTIPHELQMSRRHARIDRRQGNGQWQWFLRDLNSTNGTFVRSRRVRLRDKDELLLGADLVRFLQPGGPETAVLLKVAPTKYEEKVVLRPDTHWIGTSSSQCLPLLQGNRFLDPRHLRLEVDELGQWRMFDCGSTNHVWVRIEEVRLVDGCCFQAGEQRFSFHLP